MDRSNEDRIMEGLKSKAACLVCGCGHTAVEDLENALQIARNIDFRYNGVSFRDFLVRETAEHFRLHKKMCGTWVAKQMWTETRFPEGAEL